MQKKTSLLETYSYNFYSRGAEPLLDSIRIERASCRSRVNEYRSDHVQLIFFTKGSGHIIVNGTAQEVSAGFLAKLFSYHITAIEPEGDLEYITCSFSLSVLMYLDVSKRFSEASYTVVDSGEYMTALAPEDARRTNDAFCELEQEQKEKQPHYLTAALGNLLRILSVFDRTAEAQYAQGHSIRRSLAWQILQYIHMHFNREGMDSAHVAQRFGITPLMLGSALRRLTGKGFPETLHEVRIRNACAMMHFEELSIVYISRYVGYNSPATFYRVFKREKGVTPEDYARGVTGNTPVSKHRDTAWKILLYLMENYSKNIRRETVAEELYIGDDTLAHICMENFGTTFSGLLEQIRLIFACSLLSLPQLKIQDVMTAVGFGSMRTFSRSFQKHLGTTPQRFREAQAQGAAL